jgi:hypothetical protein
MEGVRFFLGLFVDFNVTCTVFNTPARAEDIVPTAPLDNTTEDRCDQELHLRTLWGEGNFTFL